MKNIQRTRQIVQWLCVGLTIIGFFTNYQITMAIIMVLTVFAGVFYCGWVCPYGSMQDLFSMLGRRLGIRKRKMPKVIQKYLQLSRYILMLLVTVFTLDIIFEVLSYDPRNAFTALLTGGSITIIAAVVLSGFLLIGLFFDRPFCNYLCFEGAKYGLFSSFRLVSIHKDDSNCIDCKKCDKACPMNIEVSSKEVLQSLQCINCFECISSCPKANTLSYKAISFTRPVIKRYIIAFVGLCILLIYFLLSGIPSRDENRMSTDQSITVEANSTKEPLTLNSSSTIADTTPIITEEVNIDSLPDSIASGVEDGLYTGSGDGFRASMTVEVEVANEAIVSVEVISHREDAKWYNRANNVIPSSIVDSQTTDIDVVSGATYSSLGIIEGVEDALNSAK